jgi:hypothetical protein
MDEKEQLSGADTEIQDHAEQDNVQNVPAPDFSELALFLAKSYGQMLKDREWLKAVIDAGVPIYTKEMALRDLAFISIDYESERVQTSNISNIPLRITELLDNGYVEKMNRKLRREMDESVKEYGYLSWKIEAVETAMQERMDRKERAIFERVFIRGKSYRQVCKAYKKGTLHNKQVSQIKKRCLQAIANHLKNISSFPVYNEYMKKLLREWQAREE